MDDMRHGQHEAEAVHPAAGAPLRRAHRAAWFTFTFMAGTTMTFQTYHSVKAGQMPWPLAVLFGIAAFMLAIMVLEFARHSPSRWVRGGAYALTAGAMYLSASATGDVVLHAAPPHASLLFGFLMDGAAILAIHFIFNGPTAAHAVAEVAHREAELLAEADAQRSAREQDQAAHRAALADLERRAMAEIEGRDRALADAAEALAVARSEADAATAKLEMVRRKLEAAGRKRAAVTGGTGSRKPAGSGTRKPEAATAPAAPEGIPEAPADLDAESAVLWYVDQGLSASAAGVAAGLSDSRGRQIVRKLTAPAPAGVDPAAGAGNGGTGAPETAAGND